MKPAILAALLAGAIVTVTDVAAQRQNGAADLAAVVAKWLDFESGADWESLDKLPGIKWATLPPRELTNCLGDGSCFVRQGVASLSGRALTILGTGARTIVTTVLIRNGSTPFGEATLLEAVKAAGVTAELARCPSKGSTGGTNWYRLSMEGGHPAVLAVQTKCAGKACEGLTLTHGADLPQLQPAQVKLYSAQCSEGATREATSTTLPHEALADAIVALLVPGEGTGHEWKALAGLGAGISWLGTGPKAADLSAFNDRNPMMQSGEASYADRKFSVMASGTAAKATIVRFDEQHLHPKGEHMLGVVYQRGMTVQLVRCGPVYTESTNNWYRITSSKTHPAMIRQSIRYDGNNVQDAYELRLDGSLPPRDPRDRDPGVNGCR